MKILVLNSGSSSLKFRLYRFGDTDRAESLAGGEIERIGEEGGARLIWSAEGRRSLEPVHAASHEEAFALLEERLGSSGILKSFGQLDGAGHRVVHGAEAFDAPVRITPEVIAAIRRAIPLAPLHNPHNLEGIEILRAKAPRLPQVAVFDTAFHRTLPEAARYYALPPQLYEKYGIRRYGFHGISHDYVSRKAAECMRRPREELALISLHLGNGASACAVDGGHSVETSMGMTPLEGLVMGSRCGDLDPGVPLYLLEQEGWSAQRLDELLNTRSGLLGVAGENDMRRIEERMTQGDPRARLAFDLFIHRLLKYVGAYAVLLESVDALIFTGGIGAHSVRVRRELCRRLKILGVEMDDELNREGKGCFSFHTARSSVELWCIPTDEEGAIARQTREVLERERLESESAVKGPQSAQKQ